MDNKSNWFESNWKENYFDFVRRQSSADFIYWYHTNETTSNVVTVGGCVEKTYSMLDEAFCEMSNSNWVIGTGETEKEIFADFFLRRKFILNWYNRTKIIFKWYHNWVRNVCTWNESSTKNCIDCYLRAYFIMLSNVCFLIVEFSFSLILVLRIRALISALLTANMWISRCGSLYYRISMIHVHDVCCARYVCEYVWMWMYSFLYLLNVDCCV